MICKSNMNNIIKTLLIGSVLFFYASHGKAQNEELDSPRSWELGPYIGLSNYKGDLAPNPKITNSSYSFGASVKYNVDHFIGIRGSFTGMNIGANDNRVNFPHYQFRGDRFSASIFETAALIDYNFIPISHPKQLYNWSPFLVAGVSAMYVRSKTNGLVNESANPLMIALPIGGGSRIELNPQWILNFEFIARKTFTDFIDTPANVYDNGFQRGVDTNKDWIFTLQMGISYTFYRVICPESTKGI